MKNMLNKFVKGLVIPVIISILFGYICGRFIYKTYSDDIHNDLTSSRLYLVENGVYTSYDRMREENSMNNYVYYIDDNKYKTVIGITMDYNNIDKIKSLYNDDLVVQEYYVSTELLDDKQNEYDSKLSKISDLYEVKEVVDNILNLYRSDDSIRLISIN